ncbi:hypothetical protein VCHA53O466_320020 [Vibrio chagasii]|nr:hypothetical protein VCHA53O466_320020 [Vibrio chagasii]
MKLKKYIDAAFVCSAVGVTVLCGSLAAMDYLEPTPLSLASQNYHQLKLERGDSFYLTHQIDSEFNPVPYEGSCYLGEGAVISSVRAFPNRSYRVANNSKYASMGIKPSKNGTDYVLYHIHNPNNEPVPYYNSSMKYCDTDFFAVSTTSQAMGVCGRGCGIDNLETFKVIGGNGRYYPHSGLGKSSVREAAGQFIEGDLIYRAPQIYDGVILDGDNGRKVDVRLK